MSRLGSRPLAIPKGVKVQVAAGEIHVQGPKGAVKKELPEGIAVKVEGDEVLVSRDEKKQPSKAMHGLYRALINNMLVGTFSGFEKKMTLIGVGYRVAQSGTQLDFQIGFSHPTKLPIPKGIEVKIDKGTALSIFGVDKHLVGQFAATIRGLKPPEPYKGKGIRYENEYVRKKAGKAAKTAAAAK